MEIILIIVGFEDPAADRMGIASYRHADVFLCCFSIISPPSFESISRKWLPEINQRSQSPIILVGTKADRREDKRTLQRLKKHNQMPITSEQAIAKQVEIGAVKYLECSSLSNTGVTEVFDEAIKAAIVAHAQQAKKRTLTLTITYQNCVLI